MVLNFIIFGSLFVSCFGANILVLLPCGYRSHTLTFKPLFDELASRGHNITMVTPFHFPNDLKIKHLRVNEEPQEKLLNEFVEKLTYLPTSFDYMREFWKLGISQMEVVLNEEVIKNLRDDQGSKFDLIISEVMFAQEPLVAFSKKFSCPIINIHGLQMDAWSSYLTGNSLPYSYVPTYKLPFTDKMSFIERLQNTIMFTIELLGSLYYYLPIQEAQMKEFFKMDLPPLIDMLKDSRLTLIDGHYSFGYKRPLLPNAVECGGLSIKSGKPLNKEMQKLMDDSKGVVYFSLGGHYDLSKLGPEKTEAFMKAFGRLEQLVFMKSNIENIPNKPKNVITSNWFPQASILEHPKCKAFITHGGLHSSSEASFFGVPVVGMPLFSDQKFNTKFIENFGMGITLEEVTENSIYNAIKSVIDDPKYKTKAKRMSKITKDRPQETLDTCAFWVEYVLRQEGAEFLRPASLDLPFYQYFLLDVIAFITIVLASTMWILLKVLKFCFSKICSKKIKSD